MTKRWKRVDGGKITDIVEQEDLPVIPGQWSAAAASDSAGDDVAGDGTVTRRKIWVISTTAFWDRFTTNERADFLIASQIDLTAATAVRRAAAKRQLRRQDIDREGIVRLKSSKTQAFVNDMVTDGILTAPRADAILNTPGTDDELPA
jgi:hypothetical protein